MVSAPRAASEAASCEKRSTSKASHGARMAAPPLEGGMLVTPKLIAWADRCARAVSRRLPPQVEEGDVRGAAGLGLADAARLWMARGDVAGSFEAYARRRARGAIADELRRLDPLKRRQRAMVNADSEEGRVLELRTRTTSWDSLEVDPPSAMPSAATLCEMRQRQERLRDAVDALPPRLRKVIELYYEHEQTLDAIGDVLGVSEARVRQLRGMAVSRLRHQLSA